MKNIAFFMPSFIGDCINSTPAIKLVEQCYPDAKIHLIVKPLVAPIFNRSGAYNVITYDRSNKKVVAAAKLIKQLKADKIDGCLLLTNKLIDAIIAKSAKIKVIAGYKNELRGALLTHRLKLDRTRHYINRYAYIANLFCGNKYTHLPAVTLYSDKTKTIIPNTEKLKIGLSILSPEKCGKHYPVDQTIETIKLLHQHHDNLEFYLFGCKTEYKESQQVEKICHQAHLDNVTNLAGKTTVEQLVDSIATLDLLITVDSSTLHIAAACQVKTLALVGKSPSPFSIVCPINKLVSLIHNSGTFIDDEKQMLTIKPSDILEVASPYLHAKL